LILMDGEGRPYAAVESRSESVRAQLADVARAADQRRQRDEAFALAARSAALERARQLDAALGHVGRFAVTGYESLVEEVVTLDADNAAGLREKYAGPLAERRIDRAVQAMVYPLIDRADLRGALRAVDEIVADVRPPPHHRQTLTAFKGQILHTMGCEAEARRVLSEALAIDPVGASAERVRAAIERLGE
jgi:hypothetical protein